MTPRLQDTYVRLIVLLIALAGFTLWSTLTYAVGRCVWSWL